MKKLLAVLLALTMLFAFAACGGGEDKNQNDNDTGINTNNGSDLDAAPDNSEDETAKPLRGSVSGDVYTNEFAGITFTKPAEWKYLSDKELAETVNIGQDALDLSDLEVALAETATVYDMAAMDEAYGNSVMVLYENTLLSGGRKVTAEEYVSLLKTSLGEQTALSYTFESESKALLGDTEFIRGVFSAETNGVTLKQAFYVRVVDKYAIAVAVTLTNTEITEAEAMFS